MRGGLLGLLAVTILYVAGLAWADAKGEVSSSLPLLFALLPVLTLVSMTTYLIRYLRWFWLLGRIGRSVKFAKGFLAYLTGFAFTATPGKAGELLRIRYFEPLGVPASRILAAFFFERSMDLLVVLGLSALYLRRPALLAWLSVFTFGLVAVLILLVSRLTIVGWLVSRSARRNFRRLSHLLSLLQTALEEVRQWIRPLELIVAVALGLVAWGVTSAAFVHLLFRLGIAIPELQALGIYPFSMLAGAASMLPGGVGSTEATIVAILSEEGVELPTALLAAIGIRLATLWFAILCGLVAIGVLEGSRLRQS